MINLLLATWLSLPLYPLNPTDVDTLNSMNLHITAGLNGPSSVLSTGPEITLKFEYLIYHPFLFRTSLDYRYGNIKSVILPDGKLHRGTLSAEFLYYRGTKHLTGYLGFGVVMASSTFDLVPADNDSLVINEHYTDVNISRSYGMRLSFGLRYKGSYSLEIGITEINPEFIYFKRLNNGWFSESKEKFRFNDFKVSLGYIIPLKH